jgi:hypothetical protein
MILHLVSVVKKYILIKKKRLGGDFLETPELAKRLTNG